MQFVSYALFLILGRPWVLYQGASFWWLPCSCEVVCLQAFGGGFDLPAQGSSSALSSSPQLRLCCMVTVTCFVLLFVTVVGSINCASWRVRLAPADLLLRVWEVQIYGAFGILPGPLLPAALGLGFG